jgi:hypothetical protein
MGYTNFGFLSPDNIKVWQKETRHEWERKSWILPRFGGKGTGFPIEHITDIKKMLGGGTECLMQLVNRVTNDGMVLSSAGNLEGNEYELQKSDQKIRIDGIANSFKHKGKLVAQTEVADFREEAKIAGTDWGADRLDQLVMLTLSGISYAYNLNGTLRGEYDKSGNYIVDTTFQTLTFAQDVTAPSSMRHLMWDPVGLQLVPGNTASITQNPATFSYQALVNLKAYARTHRVKPLMQGGKEWYILMTTPFALAMLKLDPEFQRAIIQAGVRGDENPWFTGANVRVDGLVIYETDFVYTTTGAANGSKWGSGGLVDGARSLLLGAQSLGIADLEDWEWVEKRFQYNQHPAVFLSKMFGLKKPVYYSTTDVSNQDFSVIAFDHYTIGGGALGVTGLI